MSDSLGKCILLMQRALERMVNDLPRLNYYQKNKEKLLQKQKERRQKQKINVQKALEELEKLQKKQDLESFESAEVKKLIRRQLREDREDEERIEGSNPWQ